MSLTSFPEPKDLDLPFIERTGNSKSVDVNPYGVSNPHPGFGKDPNIMNEYGHTKYPMWVDGKLANNEAEEKALRGEVTIETPVEEKPKADKKAKDWK